MVRDYENTPRLSEFLGELSFSGYQELGFDRVLLVEGRTDIKTIQQFLRLLGKDHQMVLLSLGGSDMISGVSEAELQEVRRITEHVFAVIDSEKDSEAAPADTSRQSFAENCKRVGIDCHILDWRATENYLTDRAVKRIKGESYRALENYEKIDAPSPRWLKTENWRIAREMSLEELLSTDLGEFLARI